MRERFEEETLHLVASHAILRSVLDIRTDSHDSAGLKIITVTSPFPEESDAISQVRC